MKLQDKLTEILGIEGFRVGDVVENLDSNLLVLYNLANQTMFCIADIDDNYLESAWYKKDDLKLISRDFTLAEVLYILTKKIGIIHFTINMVNPNIMEFGDIMKYNPKTGKGMIRWIMFSQNKTQLTLFQQEQSVIDSISKIMGG